MCPEKEFSLYTFQFISLSHNLVVHFLQQPGNSGKHLRLYLFQILSNGFKTFRIINGCSFEEIEVSNHSLENMIQGKKTQCLGSLTRWKAGNASQHIRQNIAVRKHHTFWSASGP